MPARNLWFAMERLAATGSNDESPWSIYVAVGMFVASLGAIVFFLTGGPNHPNAGLAYGSFLLSVFVIVLGIAAVVGGLAWRFWQTSHGVDPDF
jgi:hypothetical protein